MRNLSGNNIWGGVVYAVSSYNDEGTPTVSLASQSATIGVDSGTLNLNSVIISRDFGGSDGGTTVFMADSIGVHKVGPGQLNLGSTQIISDLGGGGTSSWNGSIVATGSLDVQAGVVKLAAGIGASTLSGGKSILHIGSINIAGGSLAPTAKLDITKNAMVIDYTGATPIQSIRQYIKAGAAGNWTGNGITSSAAASSPNAGETGKTGLGYGEASVLSITNFLGDPVDADTILVRYTYLGDANLDGQVDISDLGRLATAWQTAGVWTGGDFNYDAFIDISDLGILATNWQVGVGAPLGPSFDQALASVGLSGVSVPEPATMGLLALSLAGVSTRRRRNE